MLGDKFNISSLLKGAKKIQEMMEQAQEELSKIEVIGESGAGAVKITMNAKHFAHKIEIEDSIYQEPKEILEELIIAAINDASNKIEAIAKSKLADTGKMFGGFGSDEDKA